MFIMQCNYCSFSQVSIFQMARQVHTMKHYLLLLAFLVAFAGTSLLVIHMINNMIEIANEQPLQVLNVLDQLCSFYDCISKVETVQGVCNIHHGTSFNVSNLVIKHDNGVCSSPKRHFLVFLGLGCAVVWIGIMAFVALAWICCTDESPVAPDVLVEITTEQPKLCTQ